MDNLQHCEIKKVNFSLVHNSIKGEDDVHEPDFIKILVVEDNAINQKVARLLLESKGYTVEIAATGKDAVYLATTHKYSLILMDLGLPDIDGLEATRQIRKVDAAIPIIALTANGKDFRRQCLEAGMNDFELKPFLIESLKEKIEKYLK
jgi:CheY-like chemotaxis protein